MNKRIVIACPGLRDPVSTAGTAWKPNDHPNQKRLAQAALDEIVGKLVSRPVLDWETLLKQQVDPGAIITGCQAVSLRDGLQDWQPDFILLPYAPSADMNAIIEACRSIFRKMFGADVVAIPIEGNPADYKEAIVGIRTKVREWIKDNHNRVKCGTPEYRILIGSGTPQLNLALMMLPYSVVRRATLHHVKDPRLGGPVLQDLEMNGDTLPRLVSREDAREARRELAALETQIAARRAELANLSRQPGMMVEAEEGIPEGFNIEQAVDEFKRRWLLRGIEEEALRSTAEGKKFNKTRLAARLGFTSRPTLPQWCEKYEIELP